VHHRILAALRREKGQQHEYREAQLASLQTRRDTLQRRIDKLYEDKLDGKIDEDFWQAKHNEWMQEKAETERALNGNGQSNGVALDTGEQIFELTQRLYPLYVKQPRHDRRRMLRIVLSNGTLLDVTLTPKWRRPFDIFAKGPSCSEWLPECASMRTRRRGPVEPEIYFRIVHVALDVRNGAPVAYREQTVEIALGPNGAFENGNIGTLTRRVPADRVVSAVPPPRGKPKPPKVPRIPRVAEFLRKALEWQTLLKSGEATNQATIARREGISRVRVTQVMWLAHLAPEIQQHVLAMPETIRRSAISERALRPIARLDDVADQQTRFQELIGRGQEARS